MCRPGVRYAAIAAPKPGSLVPDLGFLVGLTLAYSNPNPQLDGLLERLTGPLPARGPETGPLAPDCAGGQPPTAYPPAPPRALGKRLSSAERTELITAFNAGARQEDLAKQLGISIRSIKRIVHGKSNRPQATANRLTPDQRETITHAYQTTSTTQTELARQYGVSISAIKRLLRKARQHDAP